MENLQHIDFILLRLHHEQERLATAKTKNEKLWREHNIKMIEREVKSECEFLGIENVLEQNVTVLTPQQLSEVDDLLAELGIAA